MMITNSRSLARMALSLFCATATAPTFAAATPFASPQAVVQPVATTPRLTVTGQAELERPADRMRISIGVTTQRDEAQAAMDENSRAMTDIVSALQKAGLTQDEYATGRFQVHPVYSPRPRQAGPDWQPKITAYQVTNSIDVKTQKLELAGDLLEAATEAGANEIHSISFDLADPRKHRGEAIAEATRNAKADAEALAAAAGVRLSRIIALNLDHAMVQPLMREEMLGRAMDMGMEMAMEPAPPIAPGDVTINASVTIVYEIAAN